MFPCQMSYMQENANGEKWLLKYSWIVPSYLAVADVHET